MLSQGNRRVKPDSRDIYWIYTRGDDGGWTAKKVYGDVVLSVPLGQRRDDSDFNKLDRIFSTLGQAGISRLTR